MHVFLSSSPFRLCLVSFITAAVETGLWKTLLLHSGSESERTLEISHESPSNFFLLRNNIYLRSLNRSRAASFTIDWFDAI